MCREAALDIWPDGHSICKAPVPAAPGTAPTLSKGEDCLMFLQCILADIQAQLCSPCSICAALRHVVGCHRHLSVRPLRLNRNIDYCSCDKFMSICLPSANSIYGLTAIRYAALRAARYVPQRGTLWTDHITENFLYSF